MQQQLDVAAKVVERGGVEQQLISMNPATGELVWTGAIGDAAAEVAAARAAWPAWAAHSNSYRIEAVRRFANVVRGKEAEFSELIARETGKPMWEARTEVSAVVNKVQISIQAYAERTPQRKMEGSLGDRIAVRHKPHGVLAVLGPYNFPAHLPNGHIVPALIAGNAVVFKPSEKTPATGEFLVRCFHRIRNSRRRCPAIDRRSQRGPRTRVTAGHRWPVVHRLCASWNVASQAVRRYAAQDPRA